MLVVMLCKKLLFGWLFSFREVVEGACSFPAADFWKLSCKLKRAGGSAKVDSSEVVNWNRMGNWTQENGLPQTRPDIVCDDVERAFVSRCPAFGLDAWFWYLCKVGWTKEHYLLTLFIEIEQQISRDKIILVLILDFVLEDIVKVMIGWWIWWSTWANNIVDSTLHRWGGLLLSMWT